MHEDYLNKQLGRRLRRRRQLLGLSQQSLGQICGMSFQQIQKYEAAVTHIKAAKLWELSQALRVEIGYFFDGLPAEPEKPRNGIQTIREDVEYRSK